MNVHERFHEYGEEISVALSELHDAANPEQTQDAVKRLDQAMLRVFKARRQYVTLCERAIAWNRSNVEAGIA